MKENQIAPWNVRPGRCPGLWSTISILLLTLPAFAQDQVPVITGFEPTSGPPGTEVTITGEHLTGATSVQFAGKEAKFHEGFANGELLATVPADATLGPITVVTPAGTNTSVTSFMVTAVPLPEITGFSPPSGPAGEPVIIQGQNLAGASSVSFNGVEAEFTLFGDAITAYVPAAAGTGPITVVTPGGSSTSADSFIVTVSGAPVITTLKPASGRPGTGVILSGDNLDAATSVRFNGVAAEFTVLASSIFATVPDTASTGPITVETPSGVATSPAVFTVINALAPEITGFTPNAGGPATLVTITGTNLLSVTEVRFGGAAAQFTVVSDSELDATVPAAATTGSLAVSSAAGTTIASDVFYVAAQILSFEPKYGPAGTIVSIKGVNFAGAIDVQFRGVSASFTNISPVEIQATVPEGAASGPISIATPAGFAQTDGNFLLPPKILAVFPPSGLPSTQVTITGENLIEAAAVEFAGTEADFIPADLTSVIATVPDSATNGPITLKTPAGVATSPDPFYVGLFSDLAVGLTAFPDSVGVGDFLSYTLRVNNRGPLVASDVVLREQLPAGVQLIFPPSGADCSQTNDCITCQLGTMPSGGDVTIRISVLVTEGPYLTNQVTLAASSADPNLADNSASLVTILKDAPPPPPATNVVLSVALEVNALELSWPADAEGFVLESADSLTPPAQWSAVTNAPAVSADRNSVSLKLPSSGLSFYRLRKP
jgi:uncharacterized repeat protein (TIGR01451 family)